MNSHELAGLYMRAHNLMRNADGLQPQEAFDDLLKYLFFHEMQEESKGGAGQLTMALESRGSFAIDHAKLATAIRKEFSRHVKRVDGWVSELWPDRRFRLSDKALASLRELFREVVLRDLSLDIRSEALKEFMAPEMRRGLGIFLTPDSVVRAMIEIAAPRPTMRVLDPACGSGTFLVEVLRHWDRQRLQKRELEVWGVDKNPRMLLLAELNLGHIRGVRFHRGLQDSLFDSKGDGPGQIRLAANSFDLILTNPPFGVYLDSEVFDFSRFDSCRDTFGRPFARQQSELVFLEKCMQLLKPGGVLAIVLPRSVVTNAADRVARARDVAQRQGFIYAVLSLPSETFATAGTQTSTVVLFVRKFLEGENRSESIRIAHVDVDNVGVDATGRHRPGEQLTQAAENIQDALDRQSAAGICEFLPPTPKERTFAALGNLLSRVHAESETQVTLGEIAELITTGRTPARAKYADAGLFILKVGNLTGGGISWDARERNFIDGAEAEKRRQAGLLVKRGDILLTSSAHAPRYIAKKVDLVGQIPEWVGGEASFVGEVMLIRPDQSKVDPFALLAFLRAPSSTARIQRLIRGQTAHLHPSDLSTLPVPAVLSDPPLALAQACELLKRETRLAEEQAQTSFEQQKLLDEIFT